MATESPNVKYDHVYAIIRLDQGPTPCASLDKNLITITKVLRSKEEAEREVRRLNALNADKGCEYYCLATRLERQTTSEPEALPDAGSASLACD
jgi:hypothetical protein